METKRRNIVRMKTVCEMVGLTKPTIYNRVKEGTFPAPMRLGPRAVGFYEDEITAWQESLQRGFGQPINKQPEA